MANMIICRHPRLLGLTIFRERSRGWCALNLSGNKPEYLNINQIFTRQKHGSGRGSRKGPLRGAAERKSLSQKPANPLASTAMGSMEEGEQIQSEKKSDLGHEIQANEFDSQYFPADLHKTPIVNHVSGSLDNPQSNNSYADGEDLNTFDSQYFEGLEKRDASAERKWRTTNLQPSSKLNQPGRTIKGQFMFEDIDLQFFDDINSSFVIEGADENRSTDRRAQERNEFDRQYFGNENIASSQHPPFQNLSEKRFIDTQESEDESYRQFLRNQRQNQEKKSPHEVKDETEASFELHDKPSEYQEVDDFADHREVHLITGSSISESILDNMPADLRGKLIAERQWREEKDELRIGNHNIEDLEPSVVSALQAVKKKRKKVDKPRRSWDLKIHGNAKKDIPASDVACSGCGAYLHCQDNMRPGFVPSEKFVELDLSKKPLSNAVCQRCWYLIHRHTALNVSIPKDSYSDIVQAIRKNHKALVVLMVDLLDFPCSIIKDLKDLIGSWRPIVIVGNKLDVLPKDEHKHERRIKQQLLSTCIEMGVCTEDKVKHIALISAKSGYGVEGLITKLHSTRPSKGDIYLLGTANVGKSTLFNRLLESDLCKARASDVIGRATISRWPGTTLNLLRFPLLNPTRQRMALRTLRLTAEAAEAKQQKATKDGRNLSRLGLEEEPRIESYVAGDVGHTFKPKSKEAEEEPALPEGDPFSLALANPDTMRDTLSRRKSRGRREETTTFNPEEFEGGQWFYDSPGVIYEDQVLSKLSNEELKLVVPKKGILPRSLVLKPGQTFFLGGLGRLDYLSGDDSTYFTVFSSSALPIKVMATEEADAVYREKAGTKYFVVPLGGPDRMQSFPDLLPFDFSLQGVGRHKSVADILFSSAGWASVTANHEMDVHLRAFTPGGLGCVLRRPSLLPYAFALRGPRRSKTSPFYNVNKQKLLMHTR